MRINPVAIAFGFFLMLGAGPITSFWKNPEASLQATLLALVLPAVGAALIGAGYYLQQRNSYSPKPPFSL